MDRDEREAIGVSLEVIKFLEERVGEDITGAHEFYIEPQVSSKGEPYVSVLVMEKEGVSKLTELFGQSVRLSRAGKDPVSVPIVISTDKPEMKLN